MQRILLQYFVYLNGIFKVNKQLNSSSDVNNNSKFTRLKLSGLLCMERNTGMLITSEIHVKADQHCQAKDCFVEDMK